MTRSFSVCLVAMTAGAVLTGAGQQTAFRSGTNTVSIYATVVDDDGHLVTDLSRDDFTVYDNGRPQELTLFAAERQPLSVVVMLDRSGSMSSTFGLVRKAAEHFVEHLFPEDRVRIGSFSSRIKIDPETFTNDKAEMRRILREELQGTGPTPLWNATNRAMDALADEDGRRVVLMFTDGKDTPEAGPNVSFEDVRARVQTEETMVYGIGLSTSRCAAPRRRSGQGGGIRFQFGQGGPFGRPPGIPRVLPPIRGLPPIATPPTRPTGSYEGPCFDSGPDPDLRDLADVGGGGYFELETTDDLDETFARVADELHQQYLLAFTAQDLDNTLHTIEVRVRQAETHVRARRSYFAAPRE